ncbi:hypothetical protein HYC85_008743 [Camellia sinensis]|uniref:DUF4220 domain-containing protein n=1 Tax=Camellia sinensis TaxID=4442 RepID=A0A7J7HU06_CAMSI|nr:hypothetical protein HYC85_008743 [Camellia sinensis]
MKISNMKPLSSFLPSFLPSSMLGLCLKFDPFSLFYFGSCPFALISNRDDDIHRYFTDRLTVASALVYVKKRSIYEFIPESVKKVWTEWELRGLILLSLTLQILLILLGKRRKYIARTWIRFTLWSAYLTADWVATVALGVISSIASRHNDNSNYFNTHPDCRRCNNASNPAAVDRELMSFWAPFLLLHLGGPDTITAYSMEDNELWLRHLLGLAVQTGVAVYIFLTSLPGDSWLPLMSLPMFVAGLIKYGERTWALRAANTERLRESLLTHPDPGPNYAKFMEEFTLKKAEGFHVKAAEVMEEATHHSPSTNTGRESVVVLKAYDLFQTFRRLFVDLILSFQDRDSSLSFFLESNWKTAFNVIEVELGFAFDVFYTKAAVVYTPRGGLLRLTSFSSTFVVLVAFVFLCNTHKDHYHLIDLIITFLLLAVAILLEMYAVFVMIRSNWTDHWLSKNKRTRDFLWLPCLQKPEKQWWSNSMAQYNLLSVCLRDKPAMCPKIQRLLRIDEFREKHRYKTYNDVSPKLKELIFNHFKKFMRKEDPSALCKHRGSFVLKEYEDCTEIEWSTKVDFDDSILIWHIATDLCYYREMEDGGGGGGGEDNTESNKEESKQISDYMLYLLVMCPALLPIGIGMIRFQDTCAEAREFFEERSHISIIGNELEFKANACKKLLYVNTEVLPIKVKGDRSKSVLFDACRLAKSLRDKKGGKWEIVSHVWVEMLAYAATRCRGRQHAQQLRKGGELLTHVWLLMAHMGITEQFQIKGHARAKLIVK